MPGLQKIKNSAGNRKVQEFYLIKGIFKDGTLQNGELKFLGWLLEQHQATVGGFKII
ncbi:hypothetical protein D3C80_2029230 [compost metagenome]